MQINDRPFDTLFHRSVICDKISITVHEFLCLAALLFSLLVIFFLKRNAVCLDWCIYESQYQMSMSKCAIFRRNQIHFHIFLRFRLHIAVYCWQWQSSRLVCIVCCVPVLFVVPPPARWAPFYAYCFLCAPRNCRMRFWCTNLLHFIAFRSFHMNFFCLLLTFSAVAADIVADTRLCCVCNISIFFFIMSHV